MRDHLREKVAVAYPYGVIDPLFHASMIRLVKYDERHGKRLSTPGSIIALRSTHLAMARNKIVRQFLEGTEDWLLFIDTDQVFDPDIIERLIESADPVERPIVSALIMALREDGVPRPACVLSDGEKFIIPTAIPAARWWTAVPGCGCVIIHRSVLVALGDANKNTAFPWFGYPDRPMPDGTWDTLGEDFTFMLRAGGLGFGAVIDTTIEVGHVKPVNVTPAMMPGRFAAMPAATVVVIPFKDKWKMTKAVAQQCTAADLVLLMNNGSGPEATKAAVAFKGAEVIDCKGLGIHEMWNAGAEVALERFPKVNLAFLNNDLELGDDCLPVLAAALRSGPENLVAVCPNYDERIPPWQFDQDDTEGHPAEVQRLQGICANKYDGTGGLAGFCFMVKGELFQAGYRFPEDCMWWFGDNDLTMTINAAGGWYGMVHAATVKHLDGGGQTGDWSDYLSTPQGQKDLAAFSAKWKLTEAAA